MDLQGTKTRDVAEVLRDFEVKWDVAKADLWRAYAALLMDGQIPPKTDRSFLFSIMMHVGLVAPPVTASPAMLGRMAEALGLSPDDQAKHVAAVAMFKDNAKKLAALGADPRVLGKRYDEAQAALGRAYDVEAKAAQARIDAQAKVVMAQGHVGAAFQHEAVIRNCRSDYPELFAGIPESLCGPGTPIA
jgi:hypothetical protein